jgi:hypothetical protein
MLRELTLGVSVLVGCVSQPSDRAPVGERDTLEHAPAVSICGEPSDRTLAVLTPANADACPLALELESDELRVRPLARQNPMLAAEPIASGRGPDVCGPELARCELSGFDDELGPIVVARVRGAESEVPVQVFVGWVVGGTLGFVETWYGPPSVVDHTRVGPVWALAPFDCDAELELLPAPRLPEAAHEPIPQTLLDLAGRWELDPSGVAQPPAAGSSRDPDTCRPLLPAIP